MKVVILAGGVGTRLNEENAVRPKPLVEIGGKPILWHIMKLYSAYGLNEFVICCGYKGHMIKDYFAEYAFKASDVTFDIAHNRMKIHQSIADPWQVTLVDTGDDTMTGGRLRRVRRWIEGTFCFTYGDGLADVNIRELIELHRRQGALATVTAVRQPGRFGALAIAAGDSWVRFSRKNSAEEGTLINGGFFVLEPETVDYIDDDSTIFEREPLQRLVADGAVAAYHHRGFWQNLDTLNDKHLLEALWASGKAPWRVWHEADPAPAFAFAPSSSIAFMQ
jgi:glucose-1-phosphate cytidylyltransferase